MLPFLEQFPQVYQANVMSTNWFKSRHIPIGEFSHEHNGVNEGGGGRGAGAEEKLLGRGELTVRRKNRVGVE